MPALAVGMGGFDTSYIPVFCRLQSGGNGARATLKLVTYDDEVSV